VPTLRKIISTSENFYHTIYLAGR